jgi:hypothetical protein
MNGRRGSALFRGLTLLCVSVGLALGWAGSGCSSPPPRSANPTRPLDERRAVEIIIRTFKDEKDRPVPGRKMDLGDGKLLEIDVGSDGKKYGVAYVTPQERLELGMALPPRDPARGDALQLVAGLGDDADARVLVLHDTEYTYDDHVGREHEASSITAERKLTRDVRDFLVKAHAEGWP